LFCSNVYDLIRDTLALSCADDFNIVGEYVNTIERDTEALLDASKDVGLEVNQEKTKCVLMSRYQKVGRKHSIKIGNRSFEDVVKFQYLGTTLQIKIACMKRLRADRIRGMLATILFRVFCLPACGL
jgi:hypothetical protein